MGFGVWVGKEGCRLLCSTIDESSLIVVSVIYRRNSLWCGMRSCLWILYKWCFQVPFGQLCLQGGDKGHPSFVLYLCQQFIYEMYCCFQEKVVGVWTEPNITQFRTFFFPWTCFLSKWSFKLLTFCFNCIYNMWFLVRRKGCWSLDCNPQNLSPSFWVFMHWIILWKWESQATLLWASTNVVQGKSN